MYHVTKSKNAKDIFENGLKNNPPSKKWVNKRRKMREKLDNIGNNIHSNWTNRKNAIFFWPNYQKSLRYAERYKDPAIVEINISDLNLWTVSNTDVELLYDDYISKSHFNTEMAKKIVKSARKWEGSRDDNLEVWTQSEISSDNIHKICDINGNPIQLD